VFWGEIDGFLVRKVVFLAGNGRKMAGNGADLAENGCFLSMGGGGKPGGTINPQPGLGAWVPFWGFYRGK
jgi:hypothetical protein